MAKPNYAAPAKQVATYFYISDPKATKLTNSIKILMICPQFKPIVGGYERSAERLSVELAGQNHQITIITEKRDKTWQNNEQLDGVTVLRLWCIYKARFHQVTSLTSFAIFLITQGKKFDIWHIHQYGLHAILATLVAKFIRRPIVLKLTNSKDQGLNKAINDLPLSQLLRHILLKVDAVAALSRETREEALDFGIPSDRIHLLGNGVDIEQFKPCNVGKRKQLREKLGIDAVGIVVYVGRLFNEKNPHGLIQAWDIAIPQLPEGWKLIIVGDGPLRADLELDIKTKELKKSVKLVGEQNNVHEWLGAADIYSLPSYNEGLSNTLLEAMSCGKPVISTLVSGVTELLTDTGAGIVVDSYDMNQFAASILKLAIDPTRQRTMGAKSRHVIENKYSIEAITNGYVKLYRNLMTQYRIN